MMLTPRRLAGALAVTACVVSACSSTADITTSGPPTTVATTTTVPGGAHPADTSASDLRARLTSVLVAHVYLTAVTTSTVVTGADDAPALAATEANIGSLSTIFTEVYNAAAGNQVNQLWSGEVTALVAYARAKVTNDSAAATKAKTDLEAFTSGFATLFSGLNVNLTNQALSDEIKADISAVVDLIDAQASKATTEYQSLATAVSDTTGGTGPPHTAVLLAAAMAKQFPKSYPGNAIGTAANLRASLTAALVDHAYLLAITTATGLGGGDAVIPGRTLDANSQELTNAVSAVYGDGMGRQFYDVWSKGIATFLDYAKAAATSDAAGQARDRTELSAAATGLAQLLGTANPNLNQAQLTTDLNAHVQSSLAVIDAQAGRSPSQFDLVRTAGELMPPAADLLSEAIAEQFRDRYRP